MHTWSDNVEIMIGSKTDDVINELFRSFYEITKKDLNQ